MCRQRASKSAVKDSSQEAAKCSAQDPPVQALQDHIVDDASFVAGHRMVPMHAIPAITGPEMAAMSPAVELALPVSPRGTPRRRDDIIPRFSLSPDVPTVPPPSSPPAQDTGAHQGHPSRQQPEHQQVRLVSDYLEDESSGPCRWQQRTQTICMCGRMGCCMPFVQKHRPGELDVCTNCSIVPEVLKSTRSLSVMHGRHAHAGTKLAACLGAQRCAQHSWAHVAYDHGKVGGDDSGVTPTATTSMHWALCSGILQIRWHPNLMPELQLCTCLCDDGLQ
jgi:hypothetical protein